MFIFVVVMVTLLILLSHLLPSDNLDSKQDREWQRQPWWAEEGDRPARLEPGMELPLLLHYHHPKIQQYNDTTRRWLPSLLNDNQTLVHENSHPDRGLPFVFNKNTKPFQGKHTLVAF